MISYTTREKKFLKSMLKRIRRARLKRIWHLLKSANAMSLCWGLADILMLIFSFALLNKYASLILTLSFFVIAPTICFLVIREGEDAKSRKADSDKGLVYGDAELATLSEMSSFKRFIKQLLRLESDAYCGTLTNVQVDNIQYSFDNYFLHNYEPYKLEKKVPSEYGQLSFRLKLEYNLSNQHDLDELLSNPKITNSPFDEVYSIEAKLADIQRIQECKLGQKLANEDYLRLHD